MKKVLLFILCIDSILSPVAPETEVPPVQQVMMNPSHFVSGENNGLGAKVLHVLSESGALASEVTIGVETLTIKESDALAYELLVTVGSYVLSRMSKKSCIFLRSLLSKASVPIACGVLSGEFLDLAKHTPAAQCPIEGAAAVCAICTVAECCIRCKKGLDECREA